MDNSKTFCGICFEIAEVPFHFESCFDVFCYTCIIKHLRVNSFCPKCLSPTNRFNLSTSHCKVGEMPDFGRCKTTESKTRILKKYKVAISHSKREIDNQFQDLMDILYKEQYKERILSNSEIGYKINCKINKNSKKHNLNLEILKGLMELKGKITKR